MPRLAATMVALVLLPFGLVRASHVPTTGDPLALMPFRFMPGVAVYRWNHAVWAVLFGAAAFAFFHILIGPTSGYLADLSFGAWMAALGVFLAFGVVTILFWGWFRFRPSPAGE